MGKYIQLETLTIWIKIINYSTVLTGKVCNVGVGSPGQEAFGLSDIAPDGGQM
jgi:hypothetical protein